MIKRISFLKRIVMSLALFSLCSLSFAGGAELAPVHKPKFDGFSILGGFGAIWMRPVNMYIETIHPTTGLYLDDTLKLSTGAYEMAPFARAGLEWGHAFNNFYLGLNINFLTNLQWNRIFNFSAPTGDEVVTDRIAFLTAEVGGKEIVRQNYAVNALMKFGYIYQQWLFYLQIGAAGSNVTIWTPSINQNSHTVPYRWVPGGAGGIGTEFLLNNSFILGVDYLLTYYASLAHPIAWNAANVNLRFQGILHTKSFTQRVGVYLKYIF